MSEPTTTTYALLGLLAVRPWTGYELTQQARRSLRYAWPSSEANLYREQRRLVRLGWATGEREQIGARARTRYTITLEGRDALARWLETPPDEPRIEIEGLVRLFFADHGSVDAVGRSLDETSRLVQAALEPLGGWIDDYLATGGPFPARAHLVAFVADLVTDLLSRIDAFSVEVADELRRRGTLDVDAWSDSTRERFERARSRCGAAASVSVRSERRRESL